MLRTGVWLRCDDEVCDLTFPTFGGKTMPLDPLFFTLLQLRADAKKNGWQRYGESDYCPRCEIKHRSKALKGGK